MGGGSSVIGPVSEEKAIRMTGDRFDQAVWDAAEKDEDGLVPADAWNALMEALTEAEQGSPPRPKSRKKRKIRVSGGHPHSSDDDTDSDDDGSGEPKKRTTFPPVCFETRFVIDTDDMKLFTMIFTKTPADIDAFLSPLLLRPLHYCILNKRYRYVTKLLELGANIHIGDGHGQCPLYYACRYGEVGIAQELLDKGAVTSQILNEDRWTALHFASFYGHKECVELLLIRDEQQRDADAKAVRAGTLEQKKASKRRALVNMRNSRGETALHLSAQHNHHTTVAVLLRYGADPNVAGKDKGFTPMHVGCLRGHKESVRLMVSRGGNIHMPDATALKRSPVDVARDYAHFSTAEAMLSWERGKEKRKRLIRKMRNVVRVTRLFSIGGRHHRDELDQRRREEREKERKRKEARDNIERPWLKQSFARPVKREVVRFN